MGLKKGTLWNNFPGIPSSSTQFTYYIAMEGMNRDVQFDEKFMKCSSEKRGLMFIPFFIGDMYNTQDLASAHYSKLTELNPHFQNDIPVIINVFDNTNGSTRLDLDAIKEYADYLTSRIDFKTKPIIRIVGGQWDNWMKEFESKKQAMTLLKTCDLLLSNPGKFPYKLDQYGLPLWWENEYGKYIYDSTRIWSEFIIDDEPVTIIPPEVEEPPVIDEPTLPQEEPVVKRYFVTYKGFLGIQKRKIVEVEEII